MSPEEELSLEEEDLSPEEEDLSPEEEKLSSEEEELIGIFSGGTEEELINHIENLSKNEEFSQILTNWYIGNNLRKFYKKKHEDVKFEIIAQKTGITEDTLKKYWKFVKKYHERDNIDVLLEKDNLGPYFNLSWWLISQDLHLSKEDILCKYSDSFFNLKKNVLSKYHILFLKLQNKELNIPNEKLAKKEETITILKAKLAKLKNMVRLSVENQPPRLSKSEENALWCGKIPVISDYKVSYKKFSHRFLRYILNRKCVRWNQKILRETTKTEKVVKKSPDLAKKEGDLVAYIKTLYWAIEFSTIATYWQMGKNILAYYEGKYEDKLQTIAYKSGLDDDFPSTGKRSTEEYRKFVLKLRNIANELGIDSKTLAKYCRFAQKYTQEDLESLSNGNVIMSWSLIIPYIRVRTRKLIEVYQIADTKTRFKEMMEILHSALIIKDDININDISEPSDPTPPHPVKSSEVNVDRLNEELTKNDKIITILKKELMDLGYGIKLGIDPQTIIEGIEKTQKRIEKIPKPAKTEEDLIARLGRLYRAGELSALTTHWRIGKAVLTYYEGKNKGNYKEAVKKIPNLTPEDYDELQTFAYRSRIDGSLQLQTQSPLAKELGFFASKFLEGKIWDIVRAKTKERSHAYKWGLIDRFERKKRAKKYSCVHRLEGKRKRLAKEHDVDDGRIYREYRRFVSGLGKIAEKLDMDRGTLGRCCQFAKEYTKEDLKIFSAAKFTMSWPLLVEKNLDTVLTRPYYIKSRELMDIFQNVTTRYKYIKAVSKWEKDVYSPPYKPVTYRYVLNNNNDDDEEIDVGEDPPDEDDQG